MENKEFNKRKESLFNFMEAVQEVKETELEDLVYKDSDDFKLRVLNRERDNARCACLDALVRTIYKDAIPLNDEYKNAYAQDIDNDFSTFIQKRCPQGIEYYIHEGIKRGSPFAKRALEAVNDLLDEEYRNKEMNPEEFDTKDMVFNTNSPDNVKKIIIIGKELDGPEIAQIISDNVKQTVASEIKRAHDNKEELKSIEKELAQDPNINTKEEAANALEFRGISEKKFYEPSLFEGIMINKFNAVESSEDKNLYGALDEYRTESGEEEPSMSMQIALTEAVKEYTALSVVKALKLESFDKYKLADMASEYAAG